MNLVQELEDELEIASPQHPPNVESQQFPSNSPTIIISSPQQDDLGSHEEVKINDAQAEIQSPSFPNNLASLTPAYVNNKESLPSSSSF